MCYHIHSIIPVHFFKSACIFKPDKICFIVQHSAVTQVCVPVVGCVYFFAAAAITSRAAFYNNADGPEAFAAVLEETLQEHEHGLVGTSSSGWFKDVHAEYYLQFKGIDMQRVRIGEGFENSDITAVVRMGPGDESSGRPLFIAGDGTAVYVDIREKGPRDSEPKEY